MGWSFFIGDPMKIKYIGLKPQSTAFKAETGITWLPGAAHDVKDVVAGKMLKHPDVFALAEVQGGLADAKPVRTAIEAAPVESDKPQAPSDEVAADKTTAPTLETLDRDALHALAKTMGVKVHHNAGAETVRTAIEAAQK